MTSEQLLFRKLMGRFVTGVTVIGTTGTEGQVMAMTANAVSAVSLSPLLLLVCVRNESRLLARLLENQNFSVNLLHADQDHISRHYGGQKSGKFSPQWEQTLYKTPVLTEANASFICKAHSFHQIGDHTVVFGEVQQMVAQEEPKPALLFAAGQYHELALTA